LIGFVDPRRDPAALAWMQHTLERGDWALGYSELIQLAGHAQIGWRPGLVQASLERGEIEAALIEGPPPVSSTGLGGDHVEEAPILWNEVAEILPGSRHRAEAQIFLAFLREKQEGPGFLADNKREPIKVPNPLLADLLGATLVDSQPELRAAWKSLDRARRPTMAMRWMTEPPPWPPASITKMLGQDRSAMSLVETLAGQISPEPDFRAAIVRSWLTPARTIDGAFLDSLARELDGRLVKEPRFIAWLRAEWTAWARQRYRRVARLANREASAPEPRETPVNGNPGPRNQAPVPKPGSDRNPT
jgi:hypothetical protein